MSEHRGIGTIDTFEDVTRVFWHEAGHAVVAWASPAIPPPVSIQFYPLEGEAACNLADWPEPSSSEEYLDFASVFLGGAAGESIGLGDFERLLRHDLSCALEVAGLVRRMGWLPRRRGPQTAFRRRLPHGLHAETKTFLNIAYDRAIAKLEKHREVHQHVYGMLSRGYCVEGKVDFTTADLEAWLGPRP